MRKFFTLIDDPLIDLFITMKLSKSKNTVDNAVSKNGPTRNLREDEKQILELSARAEHETGQKRENLYKRIRRKAGLATGR